MRNLLLFGGTFDPIHNGHLNTAINVQQTFNFQRFIFLPCKMPVLKEQAQVASNHRLAMLKLAIAEHPHYRFELDDREIRRATPSYMVTTLKDYRLELGFDIAITLLMGADAFKQLTLWFEWESILSLAHIMVINRPCYNFKDASLEILNLLTQKQGSIEAIYTQSHGIIYQYNAGLYNVSSTTIRLQLQQGLSPLDLPKSVACYIKQHHLYQDKFS